jgi:hypothetical protein
MATVVTTCLPFFTCIVLLSLLCLLPLHSPVHLMAIQWNRAIIAVLVIGAILGTLRLLILTAPVDQQFSQLDLTPSPPTVCNPSMHDHRVQ